MNLAKRAIRAADELQQQRPWLAFPVAVWKKFGRDAERAQLGVGDPVRAPPRLPVVVAVQPRAAWLYLEAELTLYAVEINVVRTYRLWPRSVAPPPYTEQDRRAFQLYAQVEKRAEGMDIMVGTGGEDDREKTSG
jgi:hypothetical protein